MKEEKGCRDKRISFCVISFLSLSGPKEVSGESHSAACSTFIGTPGKKRNYFLEQRQNYYR